MNIKPWKWNVMPNKRCPVCSLPATCVSAKHNISCYIRTTWRWMVVDVRITWLFANKKKIRKKKQREKLKTRKSLCQFSKRKCFSVFFIFYFRYVSDSVICGKLDIVMPKVPAIRGPHTSFSSLIFFFCRSPRCHHWTHRGLCGLVLLSYVLAFVQKMNEPVPGLTLRHIFNARFCSARMSSQTHQPQTDSNIIYV